MIHVHTRSAESGVQLLWKTLWVSFNPSVLMPLEHALIAAFTLLRRGAYCARCNSVMAPSLLQVTVIMLGTISSVPETKKYQRNWIRHICLCKNLQENEYFSLDDLKISGEPNSGTNWWPSAVLPAISLGLWTSEMHRLNERSERTLS